MSRRLVARLDDMGDVLLSGPAVRAVAASGDPVTYLAGPAGAAAAQLLPGVDEVLVFDAPWVSFEAPRVDNHALAKLVKSLASRHIEEAFVLTSSHQSPLPLALLLRQAGIRWIGATCADFPGTLLDLRHTHQEDLHEVEQSLDLCCAAGHRLPFGDHRRLALNLPPAEVEGLPRPYVVVHPGASAPASALPPRPTRAVVAALVDAGYHVVLTGSAEDKALVEQVTPPGLEGSVTTLTGSLGLVELAHVLRAADALVCGNTGAVHLSAAVGTPVIEAFAPVVPAHRWRPWGVAHVLLGNQDISCAGCRAPVCPRQGQPCLDPFTAESVLAALREVRAATEVLT